MSEEHVAGGAKAHGLLVDADENVMVMSRMHGPTLQTSSVAVSTGAEGAAIRDGDVSDAGRSVVQRRTNAETGCSMEIWSRQ